MHHAAPREVVCCTEGLHLADEEVDLLAQEGVLFAQTEGVSVVEDDG